MNHRHKSIWLELGSESAEIPESQLALLLLACRRVRATRRMVEGHEDISLNSAINFGEPINGPVRFVP